MWRCSKLTKTIIVRKTSIITSIKDGECRWIRSRAEAFIQTKVGLWIKIFTKKIFMIRSIINKNYYYLLLHIEVKFKNMNMSSKTLCSNFSTVQLCFVWKVKISFWIAESGKSVSDFTFLSIIIVLFKI